MESDAVLSRTGVDEAAARVLALRHRLGLRIGRIMERGAPLWES
jgi:hypothetical protein